MFFELMYETESGFWQPKGGLPLEVVIHNLPAGVDAEELRIVLQCYRPKIHFLISSNVEEQLGDQKEILILLLHGLELRRLQQSVRQAYGNSRRIHFSSRVMPIRCVHAEAPVGN